MGHLAVLIFSIFLKDKNKTVVDLWATTFLWVNIFGLIENTIFFISRFEIQPILTSHFY